MIYKFTSRAKSVIEIASDFAKDMKHNYIGTEHILYGLIKEKNGVAFKVLENNGITSEGVKQEIIELVGIGEEKSESGSLGFTPRAKKVLENSYKEAKKVKYDYIGTEHLLVGIVDEKDCIATRILLNFNIKITKIYAEILNIINDLDDVVIENKSKVKEVEDIAVLNHYGTDLTKKALEGKIDPLIGRNEEIERIIQILSRRTKNNPCLVGESGVGKTAIVEGFAQKIFIGDVPEVLKGKRVYSLDISAMVAGAKYRGDFEDRIKKVLFEVKRNRDIILFIDEIHTIVGAGSAEGAIDAANILKPMLARGEIQLIGATTLGEYRKYIEKDSALERRFSPVNILEPTFEDTILILKGLRDKYESHHNVKITDEAIVAATKLSIRYINDRFLPDKAIDLIDEAASKARLRAYIEPKNIKELQKEIENLENEKNDAIRCQKFEKAAEIRDKEKILKQTFEKESEKWKNKNTKTIINITEENIEEIISKWTGIPVKKLNNDENEKLRNLENLLHERVIGQDEAVEAVSKAIRRGRVGLKDPNKPIGSFLFLGPTGVGKTELSKALAENLFGKESDLIRIDMSEYMESHSVSKLIGSPPGYVGFEDGGQLTKMVRNKPYSVILFDEVEKAHLDVLNILLQVLDDGRLTDSNGRTTDFKNTVIIMTSNIGARLITEKKNMGFLNRDYINEYEDTKKEVISELKREFKPEFLNRIDEIIVFHKLDNKHIEKIVDIMLKQVIDRLKEQNYYIDFSEKIKYFVIEKGVDKSLGARPLKRAIQNILEDKLAEFIVDGELIKHKNYYVDIEKDNVILKSK